MANNNVQAQVTFKVFNQDYNRAMSEMDAASRKSRKEMQLSQDQLKANGTETQKLEAKLRGLEQQQQIAAEKVRLATEQYERAKATFGEHSVEAQRLEQQVLSLAIAEQRLSNDVLATSQDMAKHEKAMKDFDNVLALAEGSVDDFAAALGDDLTTALKNGTATSSQLERAMTIVGQTALGTGNDVSKLREALRQIDNGVNLYDVRRDLERIGDTAEEVEKDLSGLTDGLKNAANAASANVVAIGIGAGITAAQTDEAFTKLQGQLGMTANEAENLMTVAKDVWNRGFGEELVDVTTNLSAIKQQFGELGDEQLEGLLAAGYTLNELFEFELVESTRTASVMAKTFGIEGQTAMDLITVAAQRGANFNDELLDTLREYSPQFKALGYSAEEFTAILIEGSKLGIFGLDKLGDTAKESFLRFGDGSKSSREALADLGLSFEQIEADIQGGGETANKAFTAVASAIALVEDPAEKSALAIALMGTPIEDLGPEFQSFFGTVNTDLGNFEGAAKQAGETLEESFGKQSKAMFREMAMAFEPLGNIMLDLAQDWMPKVIEKVESFTNWFNDLSPTAQGATVAIAGITAAIGPVITIGGALVSTITSTISLFGAGSVAAGGFGAALGVLSGPVGWAVLGIAGVGTAAVVAGQQLSESSLEVQGWSNGVSEATTEALGGFMTLSENVTLALNQLAWGGQAVTAEMATNLVGIYDQMGQQVLAEMQTDHAAQLQMMTDHFINSGALTEVEEAEILDKIKESNVRKEQSHQESQVRIAEILNTAKEEKRAITELEQQEINAIQQAMKDNAIVLLTDSEREQKVIYENLKNEASEITATQAAAVVKNSLDQKEKVVAEAQDQYSKTVAEITKQRDEMGTISVEQATKLIEEAKKQRDETVKNAQDMHANVVTEAQAQATEHVSKVDWETGEVKSKWAVMKTDVSSKMSELGSGIKRDWSKAWEDTKTNTANIKKSAIDKFQEMKESITGSIEGARDSVGKAVSAIKGFFEGLTLTLPEIKVPKLPKFTLTGEFSLNPPSVPRVGINWNAKGAIFTKPTVFSSPNYGLQGFGEAGPEAAIPLNNSVLGTIGQMIAQTMPTAASTVVNIQPAPVLLDGQKVAEVTFNAASQLQRSAAGLTALTRGVIL
ncbi:MAG: phage tail tape measure protein [Solibacillus sp.]